MGLFIFSMFLKYKNILNIKIFKKPKDPNLDMNPLNRFNYDVRSEKIGNIIICAICFPSFMLSVLLAVFALLTAIYLGLG